MNGFQRNLVFDIGMHRGEDTAFYRALGYRVVGFEAHPGLARDLRRRFAGEIQEGTVRVVEGVLTGRESGGEARFFVNEAHSDWGTARPSWRDRNLSRFHAGSREIVAATAALSDILRAEGRPQFAKIDIEGMDLEVLSGFDPDTAPWFLSIESTKSGLGGVEAELDALTRLGYRRFAAVQQRTIPGSIFRGTALDGRPVSYTFERHASGPFGDDVTRWTDRSGILGRYQRIFRDYAVWGDDSWLQRRVGRKPIAALQALIRRPLPGWYDTHARMD